MITAMRGRVLDWYMKFFVVPTRVTQKTLDQIQAGLIDGFRKPKSESQCITEIKEIKQLSTKSVRDFYQRLKMLMAKVSFQKLDVQKKEWFIATFFFNKNYEGRILSGLCTTIHNND